MLELAESTRAPGKAAVNLLLPAMGLVSQGALELALLARWSREQRLHRRFIPPGGRILVGIVARYRKALAA